METISKKRILFVDDEVSIRVTLAAILKKEGFEVTVAASVIEALQAIQQGEFDILLADLNIGEPGDGFTVVSAMRRVQPRARTFILTGYPDFESALIAIRNQVDDYFTKPADLKKLIHTFNQVSTESTQCTRSVPAKRISEIIRENRDRIIEQWLTRCELNPELSGIAIARRERVNDVSDLLAEIADRIEHHPEEPSEWAMDAAAKHGITRRDQGYTLPMLLVESSLLEKTLADLYQDHLLCIDISTLIPDMHQSSEAINCAVETAIRAFLKAAPKITAI